MKPEGRGTGYSGKWVVGGFNFSEIILYHVLSLWKCSTATCTCPPTPPPPFSGLTMVQEH